MLTRRAITFLLPRLLSVFLATLMAASLAAQQCRPAGGLPGLIGSGPAASPLGHLGPPDRLAELVSGLAEGSPGKDSAGCGLQAGNASAGEPASLAQAEPALAAGNPVDVLTGTKHQRALDWALPAPDALTSVDASGRGQASRLIAPAWSEDPLVMSFARHYSSGQSYALSLGPGWSHSFETRLARQLVSPPGVSELSWRSVRLQLLQGDGRRILFAPVAELEPPARGVRFLAPDLEDGVLEERHEGKARSWLWRWPTGRTVEFDARGRMIRIEASDRDEIRLSHDAQGRIDTLTDRQGRVVRFEYHASRLVAAVLPDGLRIRYLYDERRRLSGVRYPDGRLLRYRYEDPRGLHWLTGQTEADGSQAYYRYDDQGRVIESRPAGEAAERALRFSYHGDEARGHTEVRWRDRTTRYHRAAIAGVPRLIQAEGAGCPTCPPAGLAYRRDEGGRLLEQGPWRLRRDRLGRMIALERAGSDQTPHWRVHYADDEPLARPVLIESPSVIPGLIRRLELAHNERGQITLWRETGYAPGSGSPVPIHREYRYEYARSGPAAGKPIAIERHPDPAVRTGRTASLSAEGAVPESGAEGSSANPAARTDGSSAAPTARPADALAPIGASGESGSEPLVTRLVWSGQRTLSAIIHPGAIEHRITRDAHARPVAETLPDGSRIERTFDPRGRLARLKTAELDLRRSWNESGRLDAIQFGDGERWQLAYDESSLRLETASGRRFHWVATPEALRARAAARSGAASRPRVEGLSVIDRSVKVFDADGRMTEFLRDDFGRTVLERSTLSGERRFSYDAWGRLSAIDQGALRQTLLRHDAAGRLIEREERSGQASVLTRLGWKGMRPVRIAHPEESLDLQHDDWGRLIALDRVDREGRRLRIAIERDGLGREVGRGLGDGLVLRQEYDRFGRLSRMGLAASGAERTDWLVERSGSPDGASVFDSMLGGRLRRTETAGTSLAPTGVVWHGRDRTQPLAQWQIRRGESGQIVAIRDREGESRFGYDRHGRLAIRQGSHATAEYFLYSPAGDLLARRDSGGITEVLAPARSDPLGRPQVWGGWRLQYGPSGRIERAESQTRSAGAEAPGTAHVRPTGPAEHTASPRPTGHPGGTASRLPAGQAVNAVSFAYNALGERARKTVHAADGQTRITRFLHHDQRLAAEVDAEGRIVRHYLYWQGRPLAVVDIDPRRPGRVEAIHHLLTDHLGTPHRAVDRAGRVVWDARYDSYGALRSVKGSFRQPLRLPGQYHDEETGLHDNYLRTYDPLRGRYLEPDPLGLAAGLNRYLYVDGRPHAASDPLGLILFAFDGTGNGNPARAPDTLSNVARLFGLYQGDDGHYMSGVGVDDPSTGIRASLLDRYDAGSARARVDAMLAALDQALRDPDTAGETVDVNVIGFSRGAAMARDFANGVASRIRTGHYAGAQRCVSLNFVGLWDTVAQFGLNGMANDRWSLTIPEEARVVVHAVAANEHRRIFPLESILSAPAASDAAIERTPPTGTLKSGHGLRIEQAFIGDHADIGGSHAEGDLADVTLSWMYQHAKAAGVDLAPIDPQWQIVSQPWLHDARSPIQPGPDREVRYRGPGGAQPATVLQRNMVGTGLQWAQTADMIRSYQTPRHSSDVPIVGEVDIAAYSDWLDETYGLRIGY